MDAVETKHETIAVNGIELAYQVRGQGEPLLLLHGFFGSSADWVHLFDLDDLARSYRLIIPDARGHGRSTDWAASPVPFTRQCAEDIRALLDHLGIQRVKAVGLSFGGNILLHMTTSTPGRVDAMVLIGAPSYFPAQARAIMEAISDQGRSEDEWREMRVRHPRGDEQIRALSGIVRGFATSHDDMSFTPPRLATITARTLIVIGDRDALYPLEIFVEQYRVIPRAALMVIPEGNHDAVFRQARPDFVRAALAFLRG